MDISITPSQSFNDFLKNNPNKNWRLKTGFEIDTSGLLRISHPPTYSFDFTETTTSSENSSKDVGKPFSSIYTFKNNHACDKTCNDSIRKRLAYFVEIVNNSKEYSALKNQIESEVYKYHNNEPIDFLDYLSEDSIKTRVKLLEESERFLTRNDQTMDELKQQLQQILSYKEKAYDLKRIRVELKKCTNEYKGSLEKLSQKLTLLGAPDIILRKIEAANIALDSAGKEISNKPLYESLDNNCLVLKSHLDNIKKEIHDYELELEKKKRIERKVIEAQKLAEQNQSVQLDQPPITIENTEPAEIINPTVENVKQPEDMNPSDFGAKKDEVIEETHVEL